MREYQGNLYRSDAYYLAKMIALVSRNTLSTFNFPEFPSTQGVGVYFAKYSSRVSVWSDLIFGV